MKLIDAINFFVCLFLGLIGVFITGTFIGVAAGLICYAIIFALSPD
jgi:hypothetical protein